MTFSSQVSTAPQVFKKKKIPLYSFFFLEFTVLCHSLLYYFSLQVSITSVRAGTLTVFSQLCLGRSFDGIDRSGPTAQTWSRVAGWKGSSQSRGQSRPKEHRELGGRRLGTACGHNLEAKRKQAAWKQDIGGGLAEKRGCSTASA